MCVETTWSPGGNLQDYALCSFEEEIDKSKLDKSLTLVKQTK